MLARDLRPATFADVPFDPARGHNALRRGRFSQPHASYFLTLCTAGRIPGLTSVTIADALARELDSMDADGSWRLRCATVMPDHLHMLLVLGERLSLHQTVQRLKAKTTGALRTAGLSWQRGFFDRKLRPDDALLPLFLYVYLNPYRAGLVARMDAWPHFRCCVEDWAWFKTMLDQDLPPPEWIT